jgi:hypothetical protein
MKVYVLISATAHPGKSRDAHKAAAETVRYLKANSNYVGKYDAVHPVQGPSSQICWMCQYESFADYEKDVELRKKDAEWAKVFEPLDQLIDGENITSQILKAVE